MPLQHIKNKYNQMYDCTSYSQGTFTGVFTCRDVTFGFDQDKEGRVKPLKNPKAVVTGECSRKILVCDELRSFQDAYTSALHTIW